MEYEDLIREMAEDEGWETFNGLKVLSNLTAHDSVNHPSHYTKGTQEAIVTIEEAIDDAVDVKSGFLQGQVLKYLLRVWLKDNPLEDLKKSRWYLDRLIDHLEP